MNIPIRPWFSAEMVSPTFIFEQSCFCIITQMETICLLEYIYSAVLRASLILCLLPEHPFGAYAHFVLLTAFS